jgi:hypothetical protein
MVPYMRLRGFGAADKNTTETQTLSLRRNDDADCRCDKGVAPSLNRFAATKFRRVLGSRFRSRWRVFHCAPLR